jgi:hypothetical protein
VLVWEIAERGRRIDIGRDEFLAELLTRVVAALAAKGGAIWMQSNGTWKLACEVNLHDTGLPERHFHGRHWQLVLSVLRTGESMLVPPGEDYGEDAGGNPTNSLLVLSPIKVGDEVIAVAEIFQRSDTGPAIQRGYQRFLTQMCGLAASSLALRRS